MLTGCVSNAPYDSTGESWLRCYHPWPCGDGAEWPAGLVGPFDLRAHEHLRVDLDTGVTLDGAVWWPDVPEGVDVPLILWATPYGGQCRYSRLDDTVFGVPQGRVQIHCDDAPKDQGGGFFEYLGSHGYAFAMFNVRGTGLSSGCYDYYGPDSRADLAALVEALAELDGVNGRVGMWGISALGTTPFMAAVEAPMSLKAIMPSGIISDFWLNRFTPQGAMPTSYAAFGAGWPTFNSVVPPGGALTNLDIDAYGHAAGNTLDRLCAGAIDNASTSVKGQYTDDRDPQWWDARNMAPLMGQIEAAVFVQQGLFESGHAFQEDAIWDLIEAPKRMLVGPWGHDLIPDEHLEDYPHPPGNATLDVVLGWFDFWLKGVGDPPRVGAVDVKDTGGAWHEWASWPPAAAEEALYLGAAGLAPAPGEAASFRAISDENGALCGAAAVADDTGTRVVYLSEPLDANVLVAGNPLVYLEITSDQPGGIVAADLFAVGDDLCDEPVLVAFGGADLRHHDGSGVGKAFPTGQATPVRVDLDGVAHAVPAGKRLAIVLSADGAREYRGAPYAPVLEIGAASHIVLPLARGTLGGESPSVDYPPRPRVP